MEPRDEVDGVERLSLRPVFWDDPEEVVLEDPSHGLVQVFGQTVGRLFPLQQFERSFEIIVHVSNREWEESSGNAEAVPFPLRV